MSSIFKSDEEVNKLLEHPNNAMRKADVDVKVKKIGSGNHGNHDSGNGKKNGEQIRDVEDQADIAVLANLIGNKATKEIMDIGSTQISQHKNGKNSNGDRNGELVTITESRLDKIGSKAIDKVDLFLEVLSSDKVQDMAPDKAATSALKMIDVYDKLKRRHEQTHGDGSGGVQVVFFAPVQMNINEYESKEV